MEYSIRRLFNICSLLSTRVANKIEGRQRMGQANRNNLQSTCSSNTIFFAISIDLPSPIIAGTVGCCRQRRSRQSSAQPHIACKHQTKHKFWRD